MNDKYIKTIERIEFGSPAHRAGLKARDIVISINNEPLIDFIDEKFFGSLANLDIVINRRGKEKNINIIKHADESLGIDYKESLYPEYKQCVNRCKFCFVDQLPDGMRESLYVKDDDWRYSIAFGNYVTLTNISNSEMDRLIRRKASPLYISIHAINAKVRTEIMGNKNASRIKQQLERLADNNISMHTQVVLCPDYNGGEILEETISYLASLYPMVKSLAVVPVGMTKYRENLEKLTPVSEEYACSTIDFINEFNSKFMDKNSHEFVFASDEMYSIANREFPIYTDGYYSAQINNGVGMINQLNEELDDALKFYNDEISLLDTNKKIVPLTGFSSFNNTCMLYNKIKDKAKNINIDVIKVVNNTFGTSITVTGLICGKDILNQLINVNPDVIIIPTNMLRDGKDTFLDDITVYDIEREKDCKVLVQELDGYSMLEVLLENPLIGRK